jgi:HEXXH motif-containing protein
LLEQRFEELSKRARAEDECIFEGLRLLPEASRLTILRSPRISEGLVRSHGPRMDSILVTEALMAELAQAGMLAELPRPVWTARGDRCFVPGPGGVRPMGAEEVVGDAQIALDAGSPFSFPQIDPAGDNLVPIEGEERAQAKRNIGGALDVLHAILPAVHGLIVDFTEVIAVRADNKEGVGLRSSSFDSRLGLILLTNPHQAVAVLERMMDALVHETIHNVLFVYEMTTGRFVPVPADGRHRLESPWSGAVLSLPAYVHACAVWYGLYWLWTAALERAGDLISTDRARALQRRAQAGFRLRPVSDRLLPLRGSVSEEAFQLLEAMEARMLSTFPAV